MIPVGIGFVNFIESDSAQKAGCDCLGMIGLVTGKRNNPMAIAAIALKFFDVTIVYHILLRKYMT